MSREDTAWTIMTGVMAAAMLAVVFAVLFALVKMADDTPEERIRRVTVDGQECVVTERWNGRPTGITCDWNSR